MAIPELKAFLDSQTVGSLVASQVSGGLVRAVGTDTVATVCNLLADQKISSLPIANPATPNQTLGLVEFADVVAHVVASLEVDGHTHTHKLEDGDEFLQKIAATAVAQAVDLSGRNPLVFIRDSATLTEAVAVFADKHLRRLAVTNAAGEVVAILSPSALIKSLLPICIQHKALAPLSDTISALNLGNSPVKFVTKTQSVLEAMDLMYHNHISVVAVVEDATHELLGSLSISDIRAVFRKQRYSLLLDSVWHLIQAVREASVFESFPYYSVSPSSTLEKVLEKIVATHVHHLYVVDSNHHPTHVISLTDILVCLTAQLGLS